VGFSLNVGRRRTLETRERMIAETNAFLTWALAEERFLPRIPCRAVDLGGFTEWVRRPLGKLVASYWWHRALERIGQG
jgi:hypothetical protein